MAKLDVVLIHVLRMRFCRQMEHAKLANHITGETKVAVFVIKKFAL